MTVLLYILLILLSVFALIFLILLPKISVRIIYVGETVVYAGYSFLKFKVYPMKEKKEKKPKKTKKTKKSAVKNKDSATQEPAPENVTKTMSPDESKKTGKKNSLSDTVTFIFDIIKKVGEMFGRHGRIDIKKLIITVSKEEACDTAVQFGLMCSALSTGLALCSLFGKSHISDDVRVVPDFITGKGNVEADIKISVRGIFIISTALKILINKILKNG